MTDCTDDPWLRHWTYFAAGPEHSSVTLGEGLPDSRMSIAILDVHGIPVLIDVWELGARRDEVLEAEQLFESIRFE